MDLNIKSTEETLDKILELLKKNQPFCYTRFGDSQLMAMEGWKGHPHEQLTTPMLQLLQTKAFQMDDPDYLIAPSCGYLLEPGMGGNTFGLYENNSELVKTVERLALVKEFWHCEAIHYGMLYHPEKVRELFAEINKQEKLLIIAGEQLDVRKWFPKADFIGIPMDNAFKDWEVYLEKIYDYKPKMVLLSCGLTSQVLQYFMFVDKSNFTTLNMGSVFNALLEITGQDIHTRGWIRDNIEKLREFNKTLHG